jgi:hypothetical protein
LEKISESFLTIPTAQPGISAVFHFRKRLSIFFIVVSGSDCANAVVVNVKAIDQIIITTLFLIIIASNYIIV